MKPVPNKCICFQPTVEMTAQQKKHTAEFVRRIDIILAFADMISQESEKWKKKMKSNNLKI